MGAAKKPAAEHVGTLCALHISSDKGMVLIIVAGEVDAYNLRLIPAVMRAWLFESNKRGALIIKKDG